MNKAIERAAGLSCFKAPTEITPLGGGITNVNLRVTDGDADYVVRLGSDIPEHGVMRWNELSLSKAAYELGVAPKVVHHEPGVLVLEFLKARTFSEDDVRDPENLPRIVDLLIKTHRGLGAHLTSPVLAFWPYQVNQTYMTRLIAEGSPHVSKLPELKAEQDKLIVATGPVEMVIGHNDLLAANILDDGRQLWLIDWEYGGYNTPLFDLAGLASNNGLSEEQEREMLTQYFGSDPNKFWRSYQAMKCASLMRETLWSMTSELHSELDFDYAAYTAENFDRLRAVLSDFHNT
ncbi:choline/ethanolamine kinase family protein [Actibacterium pelagium]|uniref:Choline kinase n=1 Tax=Actibacterium pelagium TaxID=2029103 RepID=A0A917ADB0_9RHOB|nr:choline/ethanolamine kinase family protein [Actibacterium pelagium]GGE43176.1 choline kinase [Actibacterium pelagium]